ncbi:MAG: polysaccharide deacetylase [Pseudomonadales bacterium RIFCSPLOWO2_12_59_9]|nr:MAG: polysaccharide deacetylase [Pseudomonadales bacterium RIFCSPLOWO2_12_59_9]
MFRILVLAVGLFASAAQAAGPQTMATVDRASWPQQLDSPAAFDTASRAEILMFAKALLASESTDEAALKQQLGVKQVNLESLQAVRQRFWARLLQNYQLAQLSCSQATAFCPAVTDLATLRQQASLLVIAPAFAAWVQSSAAFHRSYLNEQLRLAALFPQISSEIALFSDLEHNGDELADRQFLLTFDDGPSASHGNSDRLLATLAEQQLTGLFYVLGSSVQARLQKTSVAALQTLYAGQCVGLHGWQHKSHSQWSEWQYSVSRSNALVRQSLPGSYVAWFRPPYGQRLPDSAGFFRQQGLQVGLWNIDSQDWSNKVSADAAGQRVLTLMLLWRRGVILFHDIHSKAPVAVPWLVQATQGSGLSWQDCHEYR